MIVSNLSAENSIMYYGLSLPPFFLVANKCLQMPSLTMNPFFQVIIIQWAMINFDQSQYLTDSHTACYSESELS